MRRFGTLCFLICQVIIACAGLDGCERSKCRTVRNVIQQDLIPHYQAVKARIPYQCPFFKDRDKYIANEEHKEKESSSRWTCGYCGKSFIGEIYLDKHFKNRHPETTYKESDAVCLADFCEVFRCDVLTGFAKPTFWDVALCLEEDMQDLTADCMELMEKCIPETLSWNASKTLRSRLSDSVCSFLTCKKYYEAPEYVQEEDGVKMPYVVLTVFLAIAFILYYCVAVNYFCFDTFSDLYEDSDDGKPATSQKPGSLFADETLQLDKRVLARKDKLPKSATARFVGREDNSELFQMKKGYRRKDLKSTLQSLQGGR